jgi:hypothetical protein
LAQALLQQFERDIMFAIRIAARLSFSHDAIEARKGGAEAIISAAAWAQSLSPGSRNWNLQKCIDAFV